MGNITTRRRLLGAIPAVTAAAVAPATFAASLADNPDAQIERAWEARRAAYARYNALPFDECLPGEPYSAEERREWAIIDQAEEVIRASVAKTPRGVAIQLWCAFQHAVRTSEEERIVLARDMAALQKRDRALDWNERMIVAALRSLETMGA